MPASPFQLSLLDPAPQALAGQSVASLGAIHCSLHDGTGKVLAASAIGLAPSGEAALASILASENVSLAAGDLVVTNDLDLGAVSPCELLLVARIPNQGEGFLVVRGRIPDLGGWELGGFSPQAGDRWAEGARIVPVALRRAGRERREIIDIFRLNSRTPALTIAAVRELAERVQAVAASCGDGLQAALAELRAQEEREIAQRMALLVPREGSSEITLGWSNESPGLVRAVATRSDAGLRITIEGPAISGMPINLSRPSATGIAAAAVACAMKSGNLRTGGLLDHLTIDVADGTLLSAGLPVCMGLGWDTTGRALFEAVAEAVGVDRNSAQEGWRRFAATTAPGALDERTGRIAGQAAAALRKLEANEAAA